MKPQRLLDCEEDASSQSSWNSARVIEHEKLSVKSVLYTMTAVLMIFIVLSLVMPPLLMLIGSGVYRLQISPHVHMIDSCEHTCILALTESIPENLTYNGSSHSHMITYDAWSRLIDSATTSIDIASFYWTLLGSDVYEDPSDWQGESILKKLAIAVKDRHIKMRIVQNDTGPPGNSTDLKILSDLGAEVRYLNMTKFFGAGVLHTKLWLIDSQSMYIGSANMDWRSLTQVKELGALVENCSCLTGDAMKLFEVYWMLATEHSELPKQWPENMTTIYNSLSPMKLKFNGISSFAYLSSSPGPFCPDGRTEDLKAILDVISKAQKYIYVAVMDYSPAIEFDPPKRFWPVIDNALRKATLERGVHVRVLASKWNHTSQSMLKYLLSLSDINYAMNARIETKLFEVPVFTEAQAKIPFSRVNHNKYMVTDKAAYIGTSNWSGDYFTSTAGIGLIVSDEEGGEGAGSGGTVIRQLTGVFLRDWYSSYAKYVKDEMESNP